MGNVFNATTGSSNTVHGKHRRAPRTRTPIRPTGYKSFPPVVRVFPSNQEDLVNSSRALQPRVCDRTPALGVTQSSWFVDHSGIRALLLHRWLDRSQQHKLLLWKLEQPYVFHQLPLI